VVADLTGVGLSSLHVAPAFMTKRAWKSQMWYDDAGKTMVSSKKCPFFDKST
jgi:hypothetical protein